MPTAEERREILEKLLEAVPHDLTKEEIDEVNLPTVTVQVGIPGLQARTSHTPAHTC